MDKESNDANESNMIIHVPQSKEPLTICKPRKSSGTIEATAEIPSSNSLPIQVDENQKTLKKTISKIDKTDAEQQQNQEGVAAVKSSVQSMMDVALLSANANQLRYLITYGSQSWSFYICLLLVLGSLGIQLIVGIALILRTKLKDNYIVKSYIPAAIVSSGIFIVMAINVLLSAFTSTTEGGSK